MSQNLSSTCGQSSPGILEETHLSCCDRLPGQSEVITQKPTVKGSSDQDPAIVVAPFSQQACEIPANNGLSHGLHQFTWESRLLLLKATENMLVCASASSSDISWTVMSVTGRVAAAPWHYLASYKFKWICLQYNIQSLTSVDSLLPGQSVLAGGCVCTCAMTKGSVVHLPLIPSDSCSWWESDKNQFFWYPSQPPFISSLATGEWHYRWDVLNGPSSDFNKCK